MSRALSMLVARVCGISDTRASTGRALFPNPGLSSNRNGKRFDDANDGPGQKISPVISNKTAPTWRGKTARKAPEHHDVKFAPELARCVVVKGLAIEM